MHGQYNITDIHVNQKRSKAFFYLNGVYTKQNKLEINVKGIANLT